MSKFSKVMLWLGLPLAGVMAFVFWVACSMRVTSDPDLICDSILFFNIPYLPLIWLYTESHFFDKIEGEEFFVIPLGILWTYFLIKILENVFRWKRNFWGKSKKK